MRDARRITGWGAAALAAVLVATASPAAAVTVEESSAPVAETPAPVSTPEPTSSPEPTASSEPSTAPEVEAPAESVEEFSSRIAAAVESAEAASAAAAVGTLVVTGFDDRYADGVYDPSKTARDGTADQKNDRVGRLLTSGGQEITATEDADGDYVFTDVPVGSASVYFTYPNGPGDAVFFDATGAASADDIERLPNGSWGGMPAGMATVNVDADGTELLVGFTGLRAVADVNLPDGSAAQGVSVAFGSAGQWYGATEYDFGGGGVYEAFAPTGYQIHLPDELGVRITAPAGYRVAEVSAEGLGNGGLPMTVTQRDGAYWVDAAEANSFTANPTFYVTLEELPKGDLSVTSFDDRYADGLFDTSQTDGHGVPDQKNARLTRVMTSEGTTLFPGIDDRGDYLFEDLPVGETKVYFSYANAPAEETFFDATGATSAEDIERLPSEDFLGTAQAVATVTVDEDGEELLIGMSAITASVDVTYPDGSPVTGLTGIEFGSGGEWFPAVDPTTVGRYESMSGTSGLVHLPDEIGLRFPVPAGYRIAEISAEDNISSAPLEITERDGAYWFDTTDLTTYFSAGDFTVSIEPRPSASVDVTYFGDVTLDGVFEAGVDLPLPGAAVYLQDAEGNWWTTTAVDGEYRFLGVAPGEATIYAQIPETAEVPEIPELPELELPEAALAVWDATGIESYLDTVRAETETISFEGMAIDPDTGVTTPVVVEDALVGVIPAELAEGEQEREIGAASVFQMAAVADATGADAAANVEVEFLANTETVDATELAEGTGVLAATEENGDLAVFGAAEYGIRATAAEGYEIVDVAALSALTGEVLEVEMSEVDASLAVFAEAGTEYRVSPEQVGGPVGAVLWAVQVAAVQTPPTDPGVNPGLPGSGPVAAAPQPAAAPSVRQLPATGSDPQPWAWMLAASLLIGAGVTARVVTRRRNG